jgi:hypothetical protein
MPKQRQLIYRVFYLNISGLTRQQAEQTIYEMMNAFKSDLPEDIKERYYVENIFIPVQHESKVELLYPDQINSINNLESLDKLIETLTKKRDNIKEKDPYGEENWENEN